MTYDIYNSKTAGIYLQLSVQNGQLLVESPHQKLNLDSFFWETSYLALWKSLAIKALKIRAPMKVGVLLLSLPLTKYPLAVKVFTSFASLLVLVSLELMRDTKFTGKDFFDSMRHMNPKKRFAYIFLWFSMPFIIAGHLLLLGAILSTLKDVVGLLIVSYVYTLNLYLMKVFVLIIRKGFKVASFDTNLVWYFGLPWILLLFGILELFYKYPHFGVAYAKAGSSSFQNFAASF